MKFKMIFVVVISEKAEEFYDIINNLFLMINISKNLLQSISLKLAIPDTHVQTLLSPHIAFSPQSHKFVQTELSFASPET